MPRRSTIHIMEIFMFCHVFQFRYSEDLSIGLMRTMKGSIHVCIVKEGKIRSYVTTSVSLMLANLMPQ